MAASFTLSLRSRARIRSACVSASTPAARATYVRTHGDGFRMKSASWLLASLGETRARATNACAAGCHAAPVAVRPVLAAEASQSRKVVTSTASPLHDAL